MKRLLIRSLSMSIVAGMAMVVEAATSVPQAIWTRPAESLHWKTLLSELPVVALDWPVGAVRARLTVATVNRTIKTVAITDTSLCVYALQLDVPTMVADERVYSLTLDYLDGSDAILETVTAEVGSVLGTNGTAARCVPVQEEAKPWTRYDSSHVVLPIPEDATTLAVDGGPAMAVTGPGWKQLNLSGDHVLALTVGEDTWNAAADFGVRGTTLFIR